MTAISQKYNRTMKQKSIWEADVIIWENKSVCKKPESETDWLSLLSVGYCCVRVCAFASALPPFFIWLASTLSFLFSALNSRVFSLSCFVSLYVRVVHVLQIFISFWVCSCQTVVSVLLPDTLLNWWFSALSCVCDCVPGCDWSLVWDCLETDINGYESHVL